MSKKQDDNSQNKQLIRDQISNFISADSKEVDLKTPLKKKQQSKPNQLLSSLSPFPLPPKFNNQHTAISQSYSLFTDGLKVIQTPYNCNNATFRYSDMEDINDQLRPITSKIQWDKTPAKSQNSSSEYQDQSQSQSNSEIIPEQYQEKQAYSQQQSQKNIHSKSEPQKSVKISFSKSKIIAKRQFMSKKMPPFVHIPEPNSMNKKVFCNCKKTKCLKLYCDCFRINQTCDGCNCVGCHNLEQYSDERNTAILVLMDRNPDPFSQKIEDDKHLKGCNCKKSFCLKKYCECYQAGLKCGQNCKCDQCKNGGGSQKRQRDRLQRQINQQSIKMEHN